MFYLDHRNEEVRSIFRLAQQLQSFINERFTVESPPSVVLEFQYGRASLAIGDITVLDSEYSPSDIEWTVETCLRMYQQSLDSLTIPIGVKRKST